MSEQLDNHWICYQCGDLDFLDEQGLCRDCQPLPRSDKTLSELAAEATFGPVAVRERVWRIE